MTIRNFEALMQPASVALIGASANPGSLGAVALQRLRAAGFDGPLTLVNPKYREIEGMTCHASLDSVEAPIDLAVFAAPAAVAPAVIADLGRKGARAAVVLSAGFDDDTRAAMLSAAQPHCLRILGPNCIGLQRPALNLDASFAHMLARPGKLALLSQSGAIIAAMLDWAEARGIGFSTVASLGDMADVDLGDMLDWLAQDGTTRAVLMYVEHVTHARKFMSAARRAGRSKPVIVVKSGRSEEAAKAAASHTGALAGSDAVYDAAFRRAGLLRVRDLEELFDAAETLTRAAPTAASDRLAILTNGGGAGVLAVDAARDEGLRLAELSPATRQALDAVLPAHWSHANPVDIIGDADGARYAAALEVLLADREADAVLVINCPTALASSAEAAEAVAEVETARPAAERRYRPLLASWLGEATAEPAADALRKVGVPAYATPASAVRGFGYLARHTRAQRQLMRTPPSRPDTAEPDRAAVERVLRSVIDDNRSLLTEPEAKAVLSAYAVPTVPTETAATPQEAKAIATAMGANGGYVVKILSRDISHKSDVGGVRLNLATPQEVEAATEAMMAEARRLVPNARIDGVAVQPMIRRPGAFELIAGLSEDSAFGPVMLFGAGGVSVEVVDDKALALPPLDALLARDMIDATRIGRLLKGFRNVPPADLDAVASVLIRLSALSADFPQIRELDINPLLADADGVIALDARIAIADAEAVAPGGNPRFVIRPYPSTWARRAGVKDGEIVIRPIRPSDERFYPDLASRLTRRDIHFRFFGAIGTPTHEQIAKLTQIDYAREMAFVALDPEETAILGVSRLACDPNHTEAEFALIVRSDMQRRGIGTALMRQLIDYARADGIERLVGLVMDENEGMLNLCARLGFVETDDPEDRELQRVTLDLTAPPGQ